MERENFVIPECYIDTNLVNCLIRKSANHQKGCPMVLKVMEERMADSFAVGVIDKDKREPKAIKSFSLLVNNNSLYVYKHNVRPHYIIQVAPAEEIFILHAAEEVGVSLADFGLPTDIEGLKRFTKRVDAKNSSQFVSLFSVLKDAPSVQVLDNLLTYLLNNRYSASIDDIVSIVKT